MKKTINNFHCSNHGYVDFIPKCAICAKELEASIRKEVVEDILEQLLKEARKTDYADRTEYDVAYDFINGITLK